MKPTLSLLWWTRMTLKLSFMYNSLFTIYLSQYLIHRLRTFTGNEFNIKLVLIKIHDLFPVLMFSLNPFECFTRTIMHFVIPLPHPLNSPFSFFVYFIR